MELQKREAESSFLAWCIAALEPMGFVPAKHQRLLIAELEAMRWGNGGNRLMIFMPPGSAKTIYTTQLFTSWLLSTAANLNIIGGSHTAEFAFAQSRKIQHFVRENSQRLGYGLATDSRHRWHTTNGGEYLATGVGGALAGNRADWVILDDPIADRKTADSEIERDNLWNWYRADLETRLRPDGKIILMNTRWHESDLAGRLLAVEPHRWKVLKIPAIATDINDPLGRRIGEPLWADDPYGYGADILQRQENMMRAGSGRDWASLYQQDPRPADGALFKVQKMPVLKALPTGGEWVRAWDLAATAQIGTRDPDWTVGLKLGRMPDRSFIIADVVRFRGGPHEVEAAIRNTAQQDGVGVRIGIPQDPGQAGKQQILYLTSRLAGYTVESSPETGSKETRAMPVVSQAEVGNVGVLDRPWRAALLDELAGFPSGAKDDQVDALSRAFGMLVGTGPMSISDDLLTRLRR